MQRSVADRRIYLPNLPRKSLLILLPPNIYNQIKKAQAVSSIVITTIPANTMISRLPLPPGLGRGAVGVTDNIGSPVSVGINVTVSVGVGEVVPVGVPVDVDVTLEPGGDWVEAAVCVAVEVEV
jgi:hypothetical protein